MDGDTHRLPKPKSRGERMVGLALSKIKSTSDLPTKQGKGRSKFLFTLVSSLFLFLIYKLKLEKLLKCTHSSFNSSSSLV